MTQEPLPRPGLAIAGACLMVNVPVLAYTHLTMSGLAGAADAGAALDRFRVWAVIASVITVALVAGAAWAFWALVGRSGEARTEGVSLRAFRGVVGAAALMIGGELWLAREVGAELGAGRTPASAVEPLVTYGWLGIAALLVYGTLTAIVAGRRACELPRAVARQRR